MRPLPNLDDEAAVMARGKASLLASARNEAEAALRDAHTKLTGCDWFVLPDRVAEARAAVERLELISILWANHVNDVRQAAQI